jgi:hypothetical protein
MGGGMMELTKKPTSEFAIASLILGIASFVQIMGTEKDLLAITFGILALRRIKQNSQLKGRDLAITGLILGILSIIAVVIFTILFWPKMKGMMMQMQRAQ